IDLFYTIHPESRKASILTAQSHGSGADPPLSPTHPAAGADNPHSVLSTEYRVPTGESIVVGSIAAAVHSATTIGRPVANTPPADRPASTSAPPLAAAPQPSGTYTPAVIEDIQVKAEL